MNGKVWNSPSPRVNMVVSWTEREHRDKMKKDEEEKVAQKGKTPAD